MESKQLLAAIWLLVKIAIIYGSGLAIYKLYFHPLSKIPGPKLFAISGLPLAIENQLRATLFAPGQTTCPWMEPLDGQKFSDIVVTGGLSFLTGTTSTKQEIARTSLFTADQESYRRQRRLTAHAFSDDVIREQETFIKQYVDLLFVKLRTRAAQQEPVDMLKWYDYTTFDIIGDLAFAEPFGCLENSDYYPWVAMICTGIKAGARMHLVIEFPFLRAILQLMTSKEDEKSALNPRRWPEKKWREGSH